MTHATPADLTIRPRDLKFVRGAEPRWWAKGDPIATAFYNAMSISFPHGERFFMDSVKAFRDQVPAELKE